MDCICQRMHRLSHHPQWLLHQPARMRLQVLTAAKMNDLKSGASQSAWFATATSGCRASLPFHQPGVIHWAGQQASDNSYLLVFSGVHSEEQLPVQVSDDEVYLVVNAGCREKDLAHLNEQLSKYKVCLRTLLIFAYEGGQASQGRCKPLYLRSGSFCH